LKTAIQIGVANGDDFVKEFILNNKDYYIYLIEPVEASIPLIENSYSFTENKTIWNFAISKTNGYLTFYTDINEGGNNQVASIYKNHLMAHQRTLEQIKEQIVPCLDLNTLINFVIKNNEIEYLFIDTEGHDCDILLSTDFSKLNIKNIIFETAHSEGALTSGGQKLIETTKHLELNKYKSDPDSLFKNFKSFNWNGNIHFTKNP
jgi:FkbM family methyltransferase